MKLSYKQKLFLYFSVIFALFTIGIIVFEQFREKTFKTTALEEKLDAYTQIVHAHLIQKNTENVKSLPEILPLFPENLRLSIIDNQGVVQFDNSIEDVKELENHISRPEILEALKEGKGREIRTSSSNQQAYLYYVKKYGEHYIRVALPYNLQTQNFLKTDKTFLYFIIALFCVLLLFLNFITNRFGESVKQLRDFALESTLDKSTKYEFPNDELGEIGTTLTANYKSLKESQKKVESQHEKLLQHIHTSKEGICFISSDYKVEFYNSLFIQYLNILTNEPSSDLQSLFSDEIFVEMNEFLSQRRDSYYETKLKKQGKSFLLRINVFEDQGFEIILNNITKQEKTRLLKQEMTSNIAHELRTPLTSIRGYLETALSGNIQDEKKNYFIEQAHSQALLLSEIIQDMGLITKMEEAPLSFQREEISINHLFETLNIDFSDSLKKKNVELIWEIPEGLKLKGNRNLLYSIFRNLIDNSLLYATNSDEIRIKMYNEDKDFYYFSISDNGIGIPQENHLNRLFERFYRITEGRTRDSGGTGLGLSIVKNAVAFHKGNIIAKNKSDGGLEFLFHLSK